MPTTAVPQQPCLTTAREIAAHVNDAGSWTTERFVTVVGPPAAGKSTLTGALVDRIGARMFRLREFAHEFRNRPNADQRLFDTRDSLGWLPEETVFLLLQAAFVRGQFPARGLVALENFPGSLTQLLLLTAIADQLRAPLTFIELTAADYLVAARARAQRVCPVCEPDPRGDPHRPALRTTRDPDRCGSCGSCGSGLLPRRGDEPQRFAARLARFRRRIPAIRRAATVLHLPYHAVDATCDPATCLHGAAEWGMQPTEWITFYEHLERVAPAHHTRVWYQPTYARRDRIAGYAADGYRGCIGRTLDRISIFPDGRAYVCSFLFDTDLHFANMIGGQIVVNKNDNEFDLFTGVLIQASCGECKAPGTCMGGCPAEELVMGSASCASEPDIVPVCRLWKTDIRTATAAVSS